MKEIDVNNKMQIDREVSGCKVHLTFEEPMNPTVVKNVIYTKKSPIEYNKDVQTYCTRKVIFLRYMKGFESNQNFFPCSKLFYCRIYNYHH